LLKISIICSDLEHPIYTVLNDWAIKSQVLYDIQLTENTFNLRAQGDFLFLVSCSEFVRKEIRERFTHSLVLHASDLPHGRGWSPHIWEILNGAKYITLTLLETADSIDSGKVWMKEKILLSGSELLTEINTKLFTAEIKLIDLALEQYANIIPKEQSLKTVPSYYPKRSPIDSLINIDEPLSSQFNLLRVCDNERYPAYFERDGYLYTVKIEKQVKLIMEKTNKFITIDGRKIGPDHPPYIIAELSANHNGDINRAFKIIEEAKKAGASAIKLQSYTAGTITMDCDSEDFQIHGGLWDGQSLHQLYQKAHLPWEWHKPLFDKAKELGITIFSSPFDHSAVDMLEKLGAPAYKIASFEAIDLPLIEYVAKTGKPMIISTGMANVEEIQEAIDTAKKAGCKQLVVLHCVSGYPAPANEYNLATLPDMAERFNVLTGLSDHTIDNITAITSVALGACVIEKHVTLDRDGGGPDDSFSLEPSQLAQLCRDSKTAWSARGNINYKRTESEKGNLTFRRSLYAVKNIEVGEVFTSENVKSIRPGFGLPPKMYKQVIGKKSKEIILRGTPLELKHIES